MNVQGVLAGGSLSSFFPNIWSHLQPPALKCPDLAWILPGEVEQYPLFQQLQEPEQS